MKTNEHNAPFLSKNNILPHCDSILQFYFPIFEMNDHFLLLLLTALEYTVVLS